MVYTFHRRDKSWHRESNEMDICHLWRYCFSQRVSFSFRGTVTCFIRLRKTIRKWAISRFIHQNTFLDITHTKNVILNLTGSLRVRIPLKKRHKVHDIRFIRCSTQTYITNLWRLSKAVIFIWQILMEWPGFLFN